MKKIIVSVLALVLVGTCTFAQKADDQEGNLSTHKKVMLADALVAAGSYYNAIDVYNDAYSESKDPETASKLAHTYYMARDYKNAEKWYKTVWDGSKDKFPESEYYYAMSMKYNGKYQDASTEFKNFQKTKMKGANAAVLKRDAKNQQKGCDLALLLMNDPVKVEVDHLGNNINHNYTDFSPKYDPDNNLIYASLVSDNIIDLGGNKKTDLRARIFEAQRDGDNWGKGTQINAAFNQTTAHTGNGAYSADGSRFYYTECNPNDSLKMICKIFVSTMKGGEWSKGDEVNQVNDPNANTTTPAVGKFKGKEILYFASNRAGGSGGMDIWYAEITGNGKNYSNPMNCGRKINTSGDEVTPFYSDADQMLYFSSNGLINIGGFDIFKTKGGEKTWENPTNLGVPFNSSVDDYYYSTDKTGKKGFLVSNRPGGFSVKSETCCDDIYEFKYPPDFTIMARTINSMDNSIISGASIDLKRSGSKVDSAVSIETYYPFFIGSNFDRYDLKAYKDGYKNGEATTSTVGMKETDTLYVDIYMEPIIPDKPIEIKNIYYALGKWDLRPESFRALDSMYNVLATNPQLKVEIGSHTDYRNSDDANIILSQHRADTVVSYLESKGIDTARLVAKGYGESVPRTLEADLALPSGKTVSKGTTLTPDFIDQYKKNNDDYEALMQMNRRTEFKIIGIIPHAIISYNASDIDAQKALEREAESKKEQQEQNLQQMDEDNNQQPDNNQQMNNTNTNNTNANTNTNTKTTTTTTTKNTKTTKTAPAATVDPTLVKKGNMYQGNAMVDNSEATTYIFNPNPNLPIAMVSKDFFIKLYSEGLVTDADFKDAKPTDLGNGTTVKGDVFTIKTLQLGDVVLTNVDAKINLTLTQNLIVPVKSVEAGGCSWDEKNAKFKCK